MDNVISAMCSYSNGFSVTGFLMIVQLINVMDVHKLLINSTTEHLSPGPVTVQVNENEIYHVAIFPIRAGTGIVDTIIAHSQGIPQGRRNLIIPYEFYYFLYNILALSIANILELVCLKLIRVPTY